MKKLVLITMFFVLFSCESESEITPSILKDQWVFVACEGNYGASNGSIYMINQLGEVKNIDNVGDVVQSIEVYKNKLFVIVNNSHKIIAYDITKDGLSLPGIEISTENSSPREMKILNDKLYFTNWNTSDVKILNLVTYMIDDSISVDGKPESIEIDGENLWVAIQMNNDFSDSNKLLKINTESKSITETYVVGKGPTDITLKNNEVYVANTYYDSNYNAFYGSSKLNGITQEIDIKYYGSGVVCGGSVMNYQSEILRLFEGGVAKLGNDLEIIQSTKIGSYDSSQLYSVEGIGNFIYFGLTNYTDFNKVKVVDISNYEIASYDVGLFPGDFAFWESN